MEALRTAIGMWDLPMGVVVVLQIGMVLTPTAGLLLMVGLLARRLTGRRARPAHFAPA
jgi:hypothetical protein